MAASELQEWGCLAVTQTVWPANLKIFTTHALTENTCQRHCFQPYLSYCSFYITNEVFYLLLSRNKNHSEYNLSAHMLQKINIMS